MIKPHALQLFIDYLFVKTIIWGRGGNEAYKDPPGERGGLHGGEMGRGEMVDGDKRLILQNGILNKSLSTN